VLVIGRALSNCASILVTFSSRTINIEVSGAFASLFGLAVGSMENCKSCGLRGAACHSREVRGNEMEECLLRGRGGVSGWSERFGSARWAANTLRGIASLQHSSPPPSPLPPTLALPLHTLILDHSKKLVPFWITREIQLTRSCLPLIGGLLRRRRG